MENVIAMKDDSVDIVGLSKHLAEEGRQQAQKKKLLQRPTLRQVLDMAKQVANDKRANEVKTTLYDECYLLLKQHGYDIEADQLRNQSLEVQAAANRAKAEQRRKKNKRKMAKTTKRQNR